MENLMFLAVNCITDCGGADILRIIKFVFMMLDVVLFIVPMGLVVMIMVDLGKSVMAGKEDDMKKNMNIIIKRLIYCVALFLVPTIVNFAIGLVSNLGVTAFGCIEYAKTGDLSVCEVDYSTMDELEYGHGGSSGKF